MPSRARECEGQQTAHKQHPKIVEISAVERHSETAHPIYGTGRRERPSYGRPTSLTLCQLRLAPIYTRNGRHAPVHAAPDRYCGISFYLADAHH